VVYTYRSKIFDDIRKEDFSSSGSLAKISHAHWLRDIDIVIPRTPIYFLAEENKLLQYISSLTLAGKTCKY
jgi:hypothetical protein